MFASLSIYGLYTYDSSIFDNLVLPEDFTDDERNDIIMTILAECSDLALLYPDWDFMKMLIGVWSKNELLIWTKMLQSERIEFNPIENYDRYETISRTVHESGDQSDNRQRATTGQSDREDSTIQANTGHSSRDETGGSTSRGNSAGNTEGINGQTAYDSDTIKDTSRSKGASSSVSQSEDTRNASATESTGSQATGKGTAQERSAVQEAESGAWQSNNRTVEAVTNHTHGNIGVTQAADMLERYREVSNFCTIDFIVKSFKDRFCVQVY